MNKNINYLKDAKEELFFSVLMTTGMVIIMLTYNVIVNLGFGMNSLIAILAQFVPVFAVAFVIEQLVISHNVHKVHKILVSPQAPQFKQMTIMTILMVTGMCCSMTLYVTLVHVGTENSFWHHYAMAVARNYPVALAAQLFVVGPLVRRIHLNIFKPTSLVD